jgi:competence protein ComEC
MRWTAPLLAAALLSGTATGASETLTLTQAAVAAASGVGGAVATWVLRRRCRLVLLAVLLPLAFGVGAVSGARAIHRVRAAPIRALLQDELQRPTAGARSVLLEGRLRGDARLSKAGAWFELEATQVSRAGRTSPASGRVRVSVSGDLAAAARLLWRDGRLVRCPVTVRDPQPFRNPGVPDQQQALARRGLALFASTRSAALVEVVGPASPLREAASAWRRRTRERLFSAIGPWSPRSAGIVTAIVTGDRAGLDEDTAERLRRAGTFHVIAISGGNVAMLAAAALVLARLFGAGPRLAPAAAGLLIALYGAMVDGGPSVARATLVAVVWFSARTIDQQASPLHVCALALGIAVIAAPLSVFDVGFALTFGATLGILVGVPRLWGAFRKGASRAGARSGARRLGQWALVLAGTSCAATLCAELSILPIAARAFGRVTWAGLVLNLAAIPAMALAQFAGLAALVSGEVSDTLARTAGAVAHLGVSVLVESARLVDVWPWMERRVAPPPRSVVTCYYAAAAAAMLLPSARARRVAGALVGGMAAAMAGGWTGVPAWAGPHDSAVRRLRVTFLDVGQGDATLVQWPDGAAVLVDTGGVPGGTFDIGDRVVVPALRALGVRRLEALVITHADPDHAGGAAAVIDQLRPRNVFEGVPVEGDPLRSRAMAAARRIGARWQVLHAGAPVGAGPVGLGVLHPPPPDWERRRVRNDDSVVLDVRYGTVSVLLMGDAGTAVEQRLARSVGTAAVTVLKLGHHGSRDASGAAWLRAVRPRAVIVSAGRFNRFGHPSPAVLERCRAAGAQVLRTDELGAIRVATDGRGADIEHWTGAAWVTRQRIEGAPAIEAADW